MFPAGEPLSPPGSNSTADRIAGIARYDPVTLRSAGPLETSCCGRRSSSRSTPRTSRRPRGAADAGRRPDEPPAGARCPRRPGAGVRLAARRRHLSRPRSRRALARRRATAIDDAYAAARQGRAGHRRAAELPRPGRLYLTVAQAEAAAGAGHRARRRSRRGAARRRTGIEELLDADPRRRRRPRRRSPRRASRAAWPPASGSAAWRRSRAELGRHPPGQVSVLLADLADRAARAGPAAAADRPAAASARQHQRSTSRTTRRAIGETVVHLDHGVCRLTGLRTVEERGPGRARIRRRRRAADRRRRARPALALWRRGRRHAGPDRRRGLAPRSAARSRRSWPHTAQNARRSRRRPRQAAGAPRSPRRPSASPTVARRFPYPLSGDQRAAIHDGARRPGERPSDGPAAVRRCRLRQDRGRDPRRRRRRVGRLPGRDRGADHGAGAPASRRVPPPLRRHRAPRRGPDPRRRLPANRAVRAAVKRGEVRHRDRHPGPGRSSPSSKLGLAVIDEEQRFGEADKAAARPASPSTCWR